MFFGECGFCVIDEAGGVSDKNKSNDILVMCLKSRLANGAQVMLSSTILHSNDISKCLQKNYVLFNPNRLIQKVKNMCHHYIIVWVRFNKHKTTDDAYYLLLA